MRHLIIEAEAQEPAVSQVRIDLFDRAAHRTDAKGVLEKWKLDEDNRICLLYTSDAADEAGMV